MLDLEKAGPQVLMYEISMAIAENQIAEVEERLKKMGQFAKDLYTRVLQLEVSQATGSLPEVGRATKVQKSMSRTSCLNRSNKILCYY